MNEKAEFAERLREAMTRSGYPLRPVVLEREFNTRFWGRSITLQAARRWLRGEAIPAQDKLQVLADWLGIEPEVLRYGVAVRHSVQERRQRWEEGLHYVERETIEAYLSLPAELRRTLREVIMTYARDHARTSSSEAQESSSSDRARLSNKR